MERKTIVQAEEGKQDLLITREFDLPLDLLFRAHVEPEILEQWMGTKVLKLENKKHGGFQFETSDHKGNKIGFNGVIHAFIENQQIIRTFEMENTPIGVQLQFLEFEKLTAETSQLRMQIIYQSIAHRAQQLKLPFSYGINMAHDELQKVVSKLK